MSTVGNARALLDLFGRSPWRELHLRVGDEEMFLAKQGGGADPMRRAVDRRPAQPVLSTVRAPHLATLALVGASGEEIAEGQVLAVLELLGEEIPLPAPATGIIGAAHAAAGALVEFDQPIVDIIAT